MGYKEALRLIEEAKETGATELDLSWQDLSELPNELFQLKQLIKLDISCNQLTSLPPAIFEFEKLTSLNLDGNQLKNLSSKIIQLRNLTQLYISNTIHIRI